MIAWLSMVAFAATPAENPEPKVQVVLRGMIERWSDPSIASVYKGGTWLGGIGIVAPIVGPLGVDVEFAFSRLSGTNTTFEIVPLSGLFELSAPLGAAQGFVGVGPTLTLFTERPETVGAGLVDGARIAAEVRGGIRVDTGLVDPPMAPAKGGPVRRVDVEIYVGRRSQLPGGPDGFALGAWRGALGLGLVF